MKLSCKKLGDIIKQVDYRNTENVTDRVLGISIDKYFMPSVANTIGTDLSRYKLISKNLFACNPMHVGRDGRLPVSLYNENNPAILSPAYFMFEIKDTDEVSPEFLMMWLRRPEFDRRCWFNTDGSVRGGITWDDICRINIELPAYEEQCNIVNSYIKISKRIKLKKEINDNLEATIQAAFEKMFIEANISLWEILIKHEALPVGWSISTIGQNASVQTGPFGSQLHEEDYISKGGIPIITVEHMQGKYIHHCSLPLVSENDVSRLSKYILLTGDIVFSRVGSVDRVVMVSKRENGWLFSGRCLRVRPLVQRNAAFFLWWFSQELVKQMVASAAVGATMPSINTAILSETPIILPPQDVLNAFDNTANHLLDLVFDNNSEIRVLEKTSEAMLIRLAKADF